MAFDFLHSHFFLIRLICFVFFYYILLSEGFGSESPPGGVWMPDCVLSQSCLETSPVYLTDCEEKVYNPSVLCASD